MSWVIAGLGNPGEEYEKTRHNTGRIMLDFFQKKNDFSDWREDRRLHASVSEGKVGKEKVILLKPNTFMNKSGASIRPLITNAKKAELLVVIYDDIDLPVGKFKISFGRSSGGHKGLGSVIKALRTKNFIRVRVGVSPKTPSGKIKKPLGEERVLNHLLGDFKKAEEEILKNVRRKVALVLEAIVLDGREKAMSEFNKI